MKTIFDTDNDCELFFKYMDSHPDLEVQLSNKIIDKIANRISYGIYNKVIDKVVDKLNKLLENSPVTYKKNPIHPEQSCIEVNTDDVTFAPSFRNEIIQIARKFTAENIKYEVTDVIKKHVTESFDNWCRVHNLDIDKMVNDTIVNIISKKTNDVINCIMKGSYK